MAIPEAMHGWAEMPLGDVVNLKRGYDLPTHARKSGPYPVVSSSGRTGAHDMAKVEPPGVVTGRYGTIGEVHFVDEPFWPLNTTLYVQDFKGNDPRFVAYLLEALDLAGLVASAAVPGINRNHLHPLIVRIPDVDLQRQLAGTMAAFDDLIENNRQRMALLDEMARLTYREWFVHFRFPGHEEVELVESSLGSIPENWDSETLVDAARLVMGQSPRSEFYNDQRVGFPFHQGVTNFGARYPEHKKWCTQEKRVAEQGDVLLSVRAPVGRINVAPDRLVIGRGLAAVRSKRDAQVFLFETLREVFAEEDSMGGGTIFKAVTRKDLERIGLVRPPEAVVAAFESTVGPMFNLVANLEQQNRALIDARDLLLPRLISGDLDVSEFHLDLEPVA